VVAAAAAASPAENATANPAANPGFNQNQIETITPLNNNGDPNDDMAVITDVMHQQPSPSSPMHQMSPVKQRKRRLKVSSTSASAGTLQLPPLDISQQTFHGRSAASAREPQHLSPGRHKRAMRVHTVPASMVLHTATVGSPPPPPPPPLDVANDDDGQASPVHLPKGSPVKKQRPHSASQHHTLLLSPLHHHPHPHPYSPSAERHARRKQKQAHQLHLKSSPEHHSSRYSGSSSGHHRTINKIETVRILRARPAFYPVAPGSTSHKSYKSYKSKRIDPDFRTSGGQETLDLPNNILGKHITLRMDRAGDLKRKRKSPVPSTNLQTAAQQ